MGERREEEEKFEVEVLRKALKTQRSEAVSREQELQQQLAGLWQRADKERKMLMSQVSQLKDELKTSSPQKLLNDVTSRLSDLKVTVSNIKDGAPISDKGLWTFDSDGEPIPRDTTGAASRGDLRGESSNYSGSKMNQSDGAYRRGVGDADSGSAKWRIKALEARVAAQQDEIRELKAQLAEREQSLTRLQHRNGVLGARLEEKEQDISTLEGRLAKLKRRLKDADSFAPRAWAVKEAVEGGYALEAAGLIPQAPGAGGLHGANNWLHSSDSDAPMVPALEEFVRQLNEPSAGPLLGMVESFLQAFLNKNPKITDYAMVHNFLGAMENPFRTHKLWRDSDEQDLHEVLDALEAYILGQDLVFASIMSSAPQHLEQDKRLEHRMACLSFVQPQHLDIKKVHGAHPALTLARKMMRRIHEVRAPQEMLECVFRAARIIYRMLNETSEANTASADDFLPVLIYSVLKAGTPRLYTAIEYMSLFRRPSRLSGERYYYLVQLQTAVAFIDHMDAASLTIDAEEFHAKYAAAEAKSAAAASNPNNAHISSDTAVGGDDENSATDAVAASRDAGGSLSMQDAIKAVNAQAVKRGATVSPGYSPAHTPETLTPTLTPEAKAGGSWEGRVGVAGEEERRSYEVLISPASTDSRERETFA